MKNEFTTIPENPLPFQLSLAKLYMNLIAERESFDVHVYDCSSVNIALVESGLRFHHSALVRNYQCSRELFLSPYDGRFGRGYVKHLPTRVSGCRGNSLHRIEYWIEES